MMSRRKMVVLYDDMIIGELVADFLIEDQVIVELKAVKASGHEHLAQCLNYLRASNKQVCLLINFSTPRTEIKKIAA